MLLLRGSWSGLVREQRLVQPVVKVINTVPAVAAIVDLVYGIMDPRCGKLDSILKN
jgi:hypothetical protein